MTLFFEGTISSLYFSLHPRTTSKFQLTLSVQKIYSSYVLNELGFPLFIHIYASTLISSPLLFEDIVISAISISSSLLFFVIRHAFSVSTCVIIILAVSFI